MAKRRRSYAPARRTTTRTIVRRSGPSPAIVKSRVSAAAKSAASRVQRQSAKGDMYAVLAAFAAGAAARKGIEIPTLGEIGTAGTIGVAMYGASMVMSGKTARTLRQASIGPLSVAAHELAEDSEILAFLD